MEKQTNHNENLEKVLKYVSKFSEEQKERLLKLLIQVRDIQNSNLSFAEKKAEIKRILWDEQSTRSKLFIGATLGSLVGLFIFGTGGIGIVALGGGIGISGILAGTAGGVLVASLIQNFEKKEK